jgi:CSLREA domain-containing protein
LKRVVAAFAIAVVLAAGFLVISGRASGLGIYLPASLIRIFASKTTARTAPAPQTIKSQDRFEPNATLAVTSTQDFGAGTGSQTSATGSTAIIPNPTSGTTWARAGAVVPNAPIVLATASNPLGTTGAYVRAVASSSTSVSKFSPWVGYTGGTEFYTSFKVLFGDSSAASTATSGVWKFYQGAGVMYSDASDFTGAQVFTGLTFTYGAGGALALTYRGGAANLTTGLTTTTFASGAVYTIEVVGNNKTSGTIAYTYGGAARTVAVQKFDLYVNGTLIGDDLAEAQLPVNTAINAGTFIGISSTANVANVFVDDAVVYNAVPADIAPTLGAYSATAVALSANGTISPGTAPTSAASINVSTNSKFKGTFTADPATGVVRVTNANPAGSYPVTVKAFSPGGSTTASFTLNVTTPASCSGAVTFASAADVSSGSVDTLATGDFNNDGKQDLAYSEVSSSSVKVRLGNGDGTFGGAATVGVGGGGYVFTVGDFNGDGKLDLAAANSLDSTITIALGNGPGTFAAPSTISGLADNPRGIAAADMNGDGKLDLVTVGTSQLTVLLGNGAGGFAITTNFPLGVSGGKDVAVGDINGDGKLDVVAAHFSASAVSVSFGDGAGGFTSTGSFSAVAPARVVLGDVDGDGDLDLAIATQFSSNGVLIRLNDGSGGFSGGSASAHAASGVAFADFNRDGILDCVSTNFSPAQADVRIGAGDGNFSLVTTSNVGTSPDPNNVVVGDFNGDGKQDFITGRGDGVSGGIAVRLGACSPLVTTTGTLTNFGNVNVGSNSAEQTYTVAGSALTNDIIVTAPSTDFQVSKTTGSGFAPSITFTQSGGTVATSTVFVRFTPQSGGAKSGNITNASTGATTQNVAVSGTGTVITTSVSSLPSFATTNNGAFSAEQTYTVSGSGLTANLVVTAPSTDFQVSTTTGSGFGSSVSLTPSSGTVATTTIFVRFSPQSGGVKGGNITNASTGATTQNVTVSGTGCLATITVNDLGDGSDTAAGNGVCATSGAVCTLRAAIQEANANVCAVGSIAINFSVTGSITLGSALPTITHEVVINGPGVASLTIDGNNATNIFVVQMSPGKSSTISNLTIANGQVSNAGLGAGLTSTNVGTVNITNCVMHHNNQIGSGASGGALYQVANGTLNITDSTIRDNSANNGDGGGLFNNTTGTVNILRSTFNNNSASIGAALKLNGNAVFTARNSTFSNNSTSGASGMMHVSQGTATFINCTVTGNTGPGYAIMPVTATINLKNTIVAQNSADMGAQSTGTFVSQGYNLIGNNSGPNVAAGFPAGSPNVNNDYVGTNASPMNAMLVGLANNGGATQTNALLAGSPAIDHGSAAAGVSTDQRGLGRPFDNTFVTASPGGDESDIGAFEEQTSITPPAIVVTGGPLTFANTVVGGTSAEQTYTVSGSGLTTDITVTAPSTDFQVSTTTGTGFGSSITFTQSGGTVATSTLFVRFTPQSTGAKSGNVTNASTGAATQNVAVSGTGLAACVAPATVYVNANWVGTAPGTDPDGAGPALNFGCDSFATIQGGIDGVAANGTVNVAAGDYLEQPIIGKNLTIHGAGAGLTNIVAPVSLAPRFSNFRILVEVNNAAVVEASGIIVKGPLNLNGCAAGLLRRFYGIYVRAGASLNLHDSSVLDIRENNPLPGTQCLFGTAIDAGTSVNALNQVGTLTLNNTVISGFEARAVTVDFTGSSATITNNTLTGSSSASTGQTVLLISIGASANISGNQITGAQCTDAVNCGPDTFSQAAAVGISLTAPANGTQVTNNTISNNDYGINYFAHPGDTSIVSGNTLTANRYFGVNISEGDLTVTNNTFSGASNVAIVAASVNDPGNGTASNSSGTVTSNTITGATVALQLLDQTGFPADGFFPVLTTHFNRIIAATTAIDNPQSHTSDMKNNWWGCNAGPGNAGCGAVTGTGVDFNPWFVLGGSATPNSISPLGTSNVAADMTHNSAAAVPSSAPPDMPIGFSATNGSMNPTSGTLTLGAASSNFTSANSNNAVASLGVDNQTVNVPITVNAPLTCPTTLTVNDGGDSDDATPGDGVCATTGSACTLRAAIEETNALTSCGPITINFTTPIVNITLITPLPTIVHSVSIVGSTADTLALSPVSGRIFDIASAAGTVSISNLTLQGGVAFETGAGDGNGGGLRNAGTATVNISNCTFFNDTAYGGIGGGAISNASGVVNVTNTTIYGNFANEFSGGGKGAGIFNGGGTMTLTSCTINANTSFADGGGVYVGGGTVNVKNTIIAGNAQQPTGSSPDVFGAFTSQGHNLIGDSSGSTGFGSAGDQRGSALSPIDPRFGLFDFYGGPTQTEPLLFDSPAIETGDDTGVPATDQRGVARPQGNHVDIGAFELQAYVVTKTADTNATCLPGNCSLREAINAANADTPSARMIVFNIPGTDTGCDVNGVCSIKPLTNLPAVTNTVFIDGYSQTGASLNSLTLSAGDNAVLKIELDGSNVGANGRGFDLENVSGVTLRGFAINHWDQAGIFLQDSSNNNITGNFIGTNVAGTAAAGTSNATGIAISGSGSSNTIGGDVPALRNVISGNAAAGIVLDGSEVTFMTIEGNFIGTNAAGAAPLPNAIGINILNGSWGHVIGCAVLDGDNVISGNTGDGVSINFSHNNTLTGNFIGTDKTGMSAIPNGTGVAVNQSSNNFIGSANPGQGNVISGNLGEGVELLSSSQNSVLGNFIGVAVDGTTALGNGSHGIEIYVPTAGSSTDNTIGSRVIVVPPSDKPNTTAGRLANTVAATKQNATTARRTSANSSGKQTETSSSLGRRAAHQLPGTERPQDTNTSGPNIIANNGGDGVRVSSNGDVNNLIAGNSIYSNSGLGINLGNDGVTANDPPPDADEGPNHLQNFPVITSAIADTQTITGTLASHSDDGRIDFYANPTCDGSGNGEGKIYLGSTGWSAGGNGLASFSFLSGVPFTAGQVITATATDGSNNTSEFSLCFTVVQSPPAQNGSIQFSALNYIVTEGGVNAVITVTRTGGSDGLVSATFATANGTAGASDYTAVSQSVSFGAGDATPQTVNIPINDDGSPEGYETVLLSLTSPTGGATLGSPVSATLTITDNDTANSVIVNTLDDQDNGACLPSPGHCSLREAVKYAPAGSHVTFAVTGTITTVSEIPFNQNLTVDGPGVNVIIVDGGSSDHRVFQITSGNTVGINGLTVAHGVAPSVFAVGGGIYNNGGTLTVNDCVIRNNFGESGGGGFVATDGTTTFNRCTFNDNNAGASGGAPGGAVYANGASVVVNINNCTFHNNHSRDGGAIALLSGAMNVNGSTIAGNSAGFCDSESCNAGAGGVRVGGGAATINNTIISSNTTAGHLVPSASDLRGTVASGDYNLIQDGGGTFTTGGAHNLTGMDPLLGPLQDNGGATPTMALGAGSPAIDQGNSTGLNTDQRGFTRPQDDPNIVNAAGGDASDIGAFEVAVPGGTISGHVGDCVSPSTNIPGVSINVTGSQTTSTSTDSNGNYSINLPTGGSYTLTPAKSALAPGAGGIDTLDVAGAQSQFLGYTSLSSCALTAADANEDSIVDTFDVIAIQRYYLGLNTGIANVGQWRFSPASHTYGNLAANQSSQDYTAVVIGDINGDLTPTRPQSDAASVAAPARGAGVLAPSAVAIVSLPITNISSVAPPFTRPVTTSAISAGDNLIGFQGDFTFDTSVVSFQSPAVSAAGLTATNWNVSANILGAGTIKTLRISAFSTDFTPLSGSGTLFNLNFVRVSSMPAATTALTWAASPNNFEFINASLAAQLPGSTLAGSVTLGTATAANGTITGRITNTDGTPVSGVVVNLSGTQIRKTITDANGNYSFANVENGGFYTVTPSRSNFGFSPGQRSLSLQGDRTEAAFTGVAMPESANPLDTAEYFVRQQYVDLLGREPDEAGFNYWSNQILACNGEAHCIATKRIDIAAAFFVEQEFQQSGAYIYNVYSGALGRQPLFSEFSVDRQQVVGGAALETEQAAFAASFVERPEFVTRYETATTAETFVDALLVNVQGTGVDLASQRADLLGRYQAGANQNESRAAVIRGVAENAAFKQSQYNAAFVLTEYFSYLRRDAEREGFEFWLNILNDRARNNYRGMVCSFVSSTEYQNRFSVMVTRTNAECAEAISSQRSTVSRKKKSAAD